MRAARFVFSGLIVFASALRGQATDNAYRNRLLGVYDSRSGQPIEGAEVTDAMAKVSALTTKTGTVTLSFLPEGGTLVRIRKVGYEPAALVVAISQADTVPLTVLLNPTAQQLPKVVTTDNAPKAIAPGLREFDERRREGAGHFITDSVLRRNENQMLRDVVRRLPGLQVKCVTHGGFVTECYATNFRQQGKNALAGGECSVKVYVDGVATGDNDLNKLQTAMFSGVEFYAGGASLPIKYNTRDATCGVLLLWSRER
jgi:hypothetical protein